MVFFILHWATVWPFFAWKPNKLNFFGLTIGSIIPDLEIPFQFLLTGETYKARSIMHSVLGALTIDLIIALIAVIIIIPIILRYLDKKVGNKKIFVFSKIDLRKHKTNNQTIIYSILIGTISHVFIDVLHHEYNPLSFPFQQYYNFNLILFNDLQLANLILQGAAMISLILMVYFWYLRNQF